MKRYLLVPLAAVALCAPSFALTAAAADQSANAPNMERMQHWAADREMVLDAKLAGMKAALKLNPDQEKLWGPFETAVQNGAKDRMNDIQQMMESRGQNERASPIDRLDTWANDLSKASSDVKQIADAAKPLYASLNETQKHDFTTLGRMLTPERARFAMEAMRHRWREGGAAMQQ